MRQDPKAVFEGDLTIAVVGLVIVFFGSILTAGGWYSTYSGRSFTTGGVQAAAPEPVLGAIVFFLGAAVTAIGLMLALVCAGMYLRARLARHKDE